MASQDHEVFVKAPTIWSAWQAAWDLTLFCSKYTIYHIKYTSYHSNTGSFPQVASCNSGKLSQYHAVLTPSLLYWNYSVKKTINNYMLLILSHITLFTETSSSHHYSKKKHFFFQPLLLSIESIYKNCLTSSHYVLPRLGKVFFNILLMTDTKYLCLVKLNPWVKISNNGAN